MHLVVIVVLCQKEVECGGSVPAITTGVRRGMKVGWLVDDTRAVRRHLTKE